MDDAGIFIKGVIVAVFAFVDIVLIMVPLLMTVSRRKKLRDFTLTAEATVTEMNSSIPGSVHRTSRTPLWYPTFQYTVDGRVYTHPSNAGTTEKHYEVGDRIKVLVDPNNHARYILPDSPGFRLATGILWAIAAFFTLATVIVGIVV